MIGLVACSSQKLDRPAPAHELYCSPLFRKSLAYALSRCTQVYVLSASHGLVPLDREVKPYDRRLGGKKERAAWGRRVASTLIDRHGRDVEYLVLAGRDYADPLVTGLRTHGGFHEDTYRVRAIALCCTDDKEIVDIGVMEVKVSTMFGIDEDIAVGARVRIYDGEVG